MTKSKITLNRSAEFYKFAEHFLFDHLPDNVCADNLNKYFCCEIKNLKDVFYKLIESAQNAQRISGVINMRERGKQIKNVLFNCNYKKIAKCSPEYIYSLFRAEFKLPKINTNSLWYRWCCSVVDSAIFVSQFDNVEGFKDYVNRFDYDIDTRMALAWLLSNKIKGMGFALACNALKEMGFYNYIKPDVHIIDICYKLKLAKSKDETEVFKALAQIAEDNNVTPYKIDKILWLISSGNYYKDGIKTKSYKNEFIQLAHKHI